MGSVSVFGFKEDDGGCGLFSVTLDVDFLRANFFMCYLKNNCFFFL